LDLIYTEPGFFDIWKLLSAFGSSLAGIISISINNGKLGLSKLWHRLTPWHVRLSGYLICLTASPT
jgi:hypothetical protein